MRPKIKKLILKKLFFLFSINIFILDTVVTLIIDFFYFVVVYETLKNKGEKNPNCLKTNDGE